jgi:ABC-2 type transport system ATP-binding protein
MTRRTTHLTTCLAAALLVAGTAACASDENGADGATTTTAEAPSCEQGATGTGGPAVPVEGVASDLTVTSFDGTELRIHWFPADVAAAAPTILMGPGWGQAGDTSTEGAPLFGALGIGPMNAAGYNVLTWDPRGFGASTGAASVNGPETEGRDMQVLLDWVSEQPEALTDAAGDPRVGMIGASYGGGIQLITAAIDCRVDALVPSLAWHSLETSLFKAETVKSGWSGVLVNAAAAGTVDPHVTSAAESGLSTGLLSDEDQEWFRDRGPGDLVDEITVPTLFIHGTVDTLFTLDEAITNYRSLRDRDVPTGMLWFCGGHGACLTDQPDLAWINEATFAWLDRYVKGDDTVDTGPAVVIVDQDGDRWSSDDYADAPDDVLVGDTGSGRLALTAASASGPVTGGGSSDILAGVVAPITPADAEVQVGATVVADDDAFVVGTPKLTLEYQGTSPAGPEPTRVFAQLVDDATGIVVGNQITPIPVTLDGETHTLTVDLEDIAHRLDAGAALTLQIVATTVAYATPRLGGQVDFSRIDVELPVVTGFTAV